MLLFTRLSLFPPQNANHLLNLNFFRTHVSYSPMAAFRVIADHVKPNLSSGKDRGKSIASGSPRHGLLTKDPRRFDLVNWRHLDCFTIKDRTFKAVDEIKGFSSFQACDQDALEKLKVEEVCGGASGVSEECEQTCLQEVKQSDDGAENVLKIAFSISAIRKTYKDATLPPNWKSFKTVIFRQREDDLRDTKKIAAFDFDGCLVNTSVKRTGADAWSLMYSSIPEKLQGLYSSGYKLVIFTNESNIERWKNKRQQAVDSKIGRLENFINRVKRPFQVFIACGLGKSKDQIEDLFRKPKPGMWRLMEEHFNSGIAIDMDQSFYVGDAAGRVNDHSDADTKFAEMKRGMNLALDHILESGLHAVEKLFMTGMMHLSVLWQLD